MRAIEVLAYNISSEQVLTTPSNSSKTSVPRFEWSPLTCEERTEDSL